MSKSEEITLKRTPACAFAGYRLLKEITLVKRAHICPYSTIDIPDTPTYHPSVRYPWLGRFTGLPIALEAMMRYLLFAGEHYYQSGGWDDYAGSFASIEAAKAARPDPEYCQWAHIVDARTAAIVLTWAESTEDSAKKYRDIPNLPAGWITPAECEERELAFMAARKAYHERVRNGI